LDRQNCKKREYDALPHEDEDEARVIQACLDGDWSKFQYIFDKYRGRVYSLALSVLRDRELAVDVAQESFIRVFKSLRWFDRRSRFATWIYRITYNSALDHYRKERKKREREAAGSHQEAVEPSHFDDIAWGEMREKLKRAMDSLPVKLRVAVHLKYAEELTYSEICKVMGCARGVLQRRLAQADGKLKDILRREISGSA